MAHVWESPPGEVVFTTVKEAVIILQYILFQCNKNSCASELSEALACGLSAQISIKMCL